jgi:hypothetical protein
MLGCVVLFRFIFVLFPFVLFCFVSFRFDLFCLLVAVARPYSRWLASLPFYVASWFPVYD